MPNTVSSTVRNTRVHYIQNKQAKLAPGHSLPPSGKAVYWMIWVLTPADIKPPQKPGVPFHSRVTTSKFETPREAAKQCYGIDPTSNMLFFNMTSRVTDMRKMMIQTRLLWKNMGGYS